MTVSSSPLPIKEYAYSGPGNYSFDFRVFEEENIQVRYIDIYGVSSDWTIGVDYTVTLTDSGLNGGVVAAVDTATDGKIQVYRELPVSQETMWENTGPFRDDLLENDMDKVVMILQEMNVVLNRQLITVNWVGDWQAATLYEVNQVVTAPDGSWYTTAEEHTSGADFDVDLASGKWILALDVEVIELYRDEAEAARDAAAISAAAALVSENASATSESNAATSESNASASAAAASTSETNAAASEATATAQASIADTRANDANNSANAAAVSESNAATSEADALTYKNVALTAAFEALQSANEAATSAIASSTSAGESAASASAAAASEAGVEADRIAAEAAAAAALVSETAAATSALNASTSETNAGNSAAAAAISAEEAAASAGFIWRQSFVAADIDGAGKLHIPHQSGIQYPMAISVWNESNQLMQVLDGVEATDVDNLFMALSSFMPIAGTWNVAIRF